jgi:hypothetical protein
VAVLWQVSDPALLTALHVRAVMCDLTAAEDSNSVRAGSCLLWSPDKPEQSRVIETLNKAAAAAA